jgi:predicted metal-dependent hydrolase
LQSALQGKADWIVRKLQEVHVRQAQQDSLRIEWRDGAKLPFLGEVITVRLDSSHGFGAAGAEMDAVADATGNRSLRVGLPQMARPEQIRDVVQAWLMRQAQAHFTQRLDHFAPQLQVQWRRLSLSNATTRWGSASADGSIRLNWRLIHLRASVVDYVVVHELSHLRVMDHGPQFWDTVRTVVPDFALLRKQLKNDAVPRW